jgi:hypothetical protein
MDDAWCGIINNEASFLSEAFYNIFNLFKNAKNKPTLYIIGKDIKKHKKNIKKAVVAGFELGNHSFSHIYLDGLKNEKIKKEIYITHNALRKFGPVKSFRAPGWCTNILIDKMLVNFRYKVCASRVEGLSFIILKIIHFIYAKRITKIFGRFLNLLFKDSFPENKKLKYLQLKSICLIPFYHTMLKYFPNFFLIFFIKISTFFNPNSYIFHARDFLDKNVDKTSFTLSILNKYFILTSVMKNKKIL